MEIVQTDELVDNFLKRVIELEERFSFARKGQESARKAELEKLLEEFCE